MRNAIPGPWDAKRLPLASAGAEGEWRSGTALVRSLQAQLGGGSIEGNGAREGGGWNFSGKVDDVDPSQLHGAMAPLPLSGPIKARGEAGAVDFDVALEAGAARRAPPARKPDPGGQAAWLVALELREATAKGRYAGDSLTLEPVRIRTSDALLEGQLALQVKAMAGTGKLQLRAPGIRARPTAAFRKRAARARWKWRRATSRRRSNGCGAFPVSARCWPACNCAATPMRGWRGKAAGAIPPCRAASERPACSGRPPPAAPTSRRRGCCGRPRSS
ncbi:hypothetical protein HK414_08495 [Ramlibacter terrae]|uniref:AsmA-like C-terminal domain-containing protein n=1 Tax=Ramlibacter terrae TaxID=2732511 RepID=A0ABX6P3H2_9BURK|nr:hypothetical protein HK414_08495 [Ramlibacter terrae]